MQLLVGSGPSVPQAQPYGLKLVEAVFQIEIRILLLRKVGTGQATKKLMTFEVGLIGVKDQSLSPAGGKKST